MGHNNGETTLEQNLYLRKKGIEWVATMSFEEFPPQDTADESISKLIEWFNRMAKELGEHSDYHLIDYNDISK